MEDKWYECEDNKVYEIDNDDRGGITDLMYKKTDGVGTYAIVKWAFGECRLIALFSDNKILNR